MNLSREIPQGLIVKTDLPTDQYVQTEYKKRQIVLHHSAGWDNAKGIRDWWASNKERVATCCALEDDGRIFSFFNSKYYAWHINIASKGNQIRPEWKKYNTGEHNLLIERQSIGVEICNWGQLKLIGGKYHTYMSKAITGIGSDIVIPEARVIHYPNKFRGEEFYERYTDHEIESLYKLIGAWGVQYEISTQYNPDMWDVTERALSGEQGVWTHASYRSDKFDCHPQPELIQMLQSL